MSDLPTELYQEILTRLPAEPLLRFRCVSKEWRSIIDHPDFIKAHLDRQTGAEDMIMVKGYYSTKLFSMSLNSINHSESGSKTVDGLDIRNVIGNGVPRNLEFPAPSCHGLILIAYQSHSRQWALWNPTTGDWLQIPSFKRFRLTYNCWSSWLPPAGLGYDVATGDYKVVRVCRSELMTLIYSLKSNQWHRIDNLFDCYLEHCGSYFNGALYWKAWGYDRAEKYMLSLDLSTETYHKLALPSAALEGSDYRFDSVSGYLLLSCYNDGRNDVWIMKDDTRWSKLITFEDQAPVRGCSLKIRAVAYLKNKHQLVLRSYEPSSRGSCKCDELFWFDLEKRTGKKINVEGKFENFGARNLACFPSTLIRPNKIADNTSTGTRKMTKAGNDKLDLNVEFQASCSSNAGLIIH